MTEQVAFSIFDGHNDALLRVWRAGPGGESAFVEGGGEGHLDLPRALAGGMRGGLFGVFVPRPPKEPAPPDVDRSAKELSPPVSHEWAAQVADEQAAILERLERISGGRLTKALVPGDVRAALDGDHLACLLHFEGAEPLAEDVSDLEAWHAKGLRSIGLVWARRNVFAEGVPLRYPASPDIGTGLTAAGKELVRQCRRLGILVDVSHLNYRGFMDVAKEYAGPVVATHSCAHAICPAARNLTDEQLRVIRDTGGIAGVSLNFPDLNPDGSDSTAAALGLIARHMEHFAAVAGVEHVGIGSDFDGCPMPKQVPDASALPRIAGALRERGWKDSDIRRVFRDNWVRVLEQTLSEG